MTNITEFKEAKIGGTVQEYLWNYDNQAIAVAYETRGQGMPLLLLPAFSTVSSRDEMRGMAERLCDRFEVVALDWPGFGDSDRPGVQYGPEFYHQFLADFVRSIFARPVTIVAAGHGAGYAMKLGKTHPQRVSKVVLVAPTWLGPLRIMGVPEPVRDFVRETVRTPGLGEFLYDLNTHPAFLEFMYKQHVFVDPAKLTTEFIAQKRDSTQHPGGRFAPVAFVTGALDLAGDREAVLAQFQPLPVPVKVIIGTLAPSGSQSVMEAVAQLSGVKSARVAGSLGMHEEYAEAVVEAIGDFL
ncbi:alpha/beta fold hydrolase [Laspinema olomoucense]|uniref:alpha/beta fold hydrolase n=1 Tax=Laspinema olomoucense TaxID=3231600 RepID=UPI0021BB2368|nr:alpha/beta hydrolase [Laspinema sp. D3d]MCT7970759.1 alpha/beta hydrolase [Laspinema sp. D3d]